MRYLILSFLALSFFSSCSDSADSTAMFCDTACINDSLNFSSNNSDEARVSIIFDDCEPDSLSWTHGGMTTSIMLPFTDLAQQQLRLNKDKVSCVFNGTDHAWLTFNDCLTGRGFLYKLPYNKGVSVEKYIGALNSFDPKFSVEENLRSYTDRGNIYVIDITTGKKAVATFGKEYKEMNFNKLHESIDSINVTSTRAYVELKENGKVTKIDKKITLQ